MKRWVKGCFLVEVILFAVLLLLLTQGFFTDAKDSEDEIAPIYSYPRIIHLDPQGVGRQTDPTYTFTTVEWSPDSSSIALYGYDIDIYDVETRLRRRIVISGTMGGPIDMAWNPDSNLIIGAASQIIIWDANTGEQVLALDSNDDAYREFYGLYWKTPNEIIIMSQRLEGIPSVQTITTDDSSFIEYTQEITEIDADHLYFFVSGLQGDTWVLSQHNNDIAFLNLDSRQVSSSFSLSEETAVLNVAISPINNKVAIVDQGTLIVLEPQLSDITERVNIDHVINHIEWSPNECQIAVATRDGLFLLDIEQGLQSQEDIIQNLSISEAHWSPNGNMLATVSNIGVDIWDMSSTQSSCN